MTSGTYSEVVKCCQTETRVQQSVEERKNENNTTMIRHNNIVYGVCLLLLLGTIGKTFKRELCRIIEGKDDRL